MPESYLNTRVSWELAQWFKAEAFRRGVPVSLLVRIACQQWAQRQGGQNGA